MMTLLAQGETKTLKQWMEQLIKWLTVGGVFVVFGVLLLGNDLVPIGIGGCLSACGNQFIAPLLDAVGPGLGECRHSSHHRLQPS